MKLIAVEGHKSSYPHPISFKKGECLVAGVKDTEYEDWIWVTTIDRNQRWAPMKYLQFKEGTNKAVARQDYSAKELDTCVGDVLTLHYELNYWGWVEKSDGSCGWIPMKSTKIA